MPAADAWSIEPATSAESGTVKPSGGATAETQPDARKKAQPAHAAHNKQQPPARTILRLRFSRSGPATWLAHLDLMRTIERSVKRADLPVHWSSGFNPRPDLVFALPIGVGLETCADYVDIGLIDRTPAYETGSPDAAAAPAGDSGNGSPNDAGQGSGHDAADYMARLSAALPEGMAIVSGCLMPAEKESIMGRIAYADYQIEAVGISGAAERAMTQEALVIDKPSKGKTLKVDIRPLILQMAFDAPNRLRLRVRAGSRENLRPDLFLQALVDMAGLDATAAADARLVRSGLYLSMPGDCQLAADPEGNPMPAEPAGCP